MSVYALEITFHGGNIRLEIKDEAIWAPTGSQLIVNGFAGNPVAFAVMIDPPRATLNSQDFKTPVDAGLVVRVDTPLDTLTLDVASDGVVAVTALSTGDAFVDQTPGERTHTLKLK
jgi:hypothetical protein